MTEIYLKNFNMASARLLAGLLFVPLLGAYFVYGIVDFKVTDLKETLQYAGLLLLVVFGAIGFAWMALTVVTSLKVGDELVVSSIFSSRKFSLAEISLIEFETSGTTVNDIKVASHLLMNVYLRSENLVQVKVSQPEAESVVSLLTTRGMGGVFKTQAA